MSCIKLLSVLALVICAATVQSCGGDDCEGVTCCSDDVLGVWNVTDIQPSGCTVLTYEFGTSTFSDSVLSISLDDGTRVLTGTGLLDSDCSAMTYTVSEGRTIVSGSITFDGAMLEDRSDFGCLISATKQ